MSKKTNVVAAAETIASGCVAERRRLLDRTINAMYDDAPRLSG